MSKLGPVAAALSVNPLFSRLDPEAIQRIADLWVTQTLRAGEVLFLKGDPGDALYGIRRGRVLITMTTETGKQLTLNVLGPGDVFGEIALLDGQERSADAIAGEHTELFLIRRSDFQELLKREPSIAINLIELLCERVRWASGRMEEATLYQLRTRMARRLLKLVDDFGEEIVISQEELSLLVGAARETVNRQLQEWKRTGIVQLGRSRIRVQDLERLRQQASLEE